MCLKQMTMEPAYSIQGTPPGGTPSKSGHHCIHSLNARLTESLIQKCQAVPRDTETRKLILCLQSSCILAKRKERRRCWVPTVMGKSSLWWWQGVTKTVSEEDVGRRGMTRGGRQDGAADEGSRLQPTPLRPPFNRPSTWAPIPTATELPKQFFFLFVEECPPLHGESVSQRALITQDQEGAM